jgi:hypothetical protein
MPCDPRVPVDLITTDWAVAALAYIFEFGFVAGRYYQACAGPEASVPLCKLIELALDLYARHPAAQKWQPIMLPRLVDLAEWEEYVKWATPTANIVLGELLRVLSYFAAHLALFQVFDNRQTIAGLRTSGLNFPPLPDCYERMVRYCLDTNWGRNVLGPKEVVRLPRTAGLQTKLPRSFSGGEDRGQKPPITRSSR